jgi:adenylate kinase
MDQSMKTILILLGPPGSGKGTQSKKLSNTLQIPQISTGDIFRDNIKRNTELGKKVKRYTEAGQLVPDSLVCDLLFDRIDQEDCKNGYILDGFPRTVLQAEELDKHLENEDPHVVNLNVDDEIIIKRLSGRLVCQNCGQMFNIYFSPPEKDQICDVCKGDLIHRKDDDEDVVKERLTVYKDQTEPLIDYYSKKRNLHQIDGEKDTSLIFEKIFNLLKA